MMLQDNSGSGGGFVQPETLILPTVSDSPTDRAAGEEFEDGELHLPAYAADVTRLPVFWRL